MKHIFFSMWVPLMLLYKPQSSDCLGKMAILSNHIPEKFLTQLGYLENMPNCYASTPNRYPSIPANIDQMLIKCWANVTYDGSTLDQHWVSVLCLLGYDTLLPPLDLCSAPLFVIVWVCQEATDTKGKGAGCFIVPYIKSEDLSSDFTLHPLVTGHVHSCVISTPRGAYSPAAVSAH